MTLVIGYTDGETDYILSDQLGSDDYSGKVYLNDKIFKRENDGILVGGAGSYRALQLVQYKLRVARYTNDKTISEYMIGTFNTALVDLLKDNFVLKESEDGLESPADFIFIIQHRIFVTNGDLALLEIDGNYAAIGDSGDYAHAVLKTLDKTGSTLEVPDRLKLAYEITERHCLHVGGGSKMIVNPNVRFN